MPYGRHSPEVRRRAARECHAARMESGPEAFAGVAFALFGAGLLVWTGVCVRAGEPVADGVSRSAGTALALLFGVLFLGTGCWLLL